MANRNERMKSKRPIGAKTNRGEQEIKIPLAMCFAAFKALTGVNGAGGLLDAGTMPIDVAYALARLAHVLEPEATIFETFRLKQIAELSNGGNVVPADKIEEFSRRLAGMGSKEVTVKFTPIKKSDMGAITALPRHLAQLMVAGFIVD